MKNNEVFYIKVEFCHKQDIAIFKKHFDNMVENKDSVQMMEEELAAIIKIRYDSEEEYDIPFVGRTRITRKDVEKVLNYIPYPTKFGIKKAYLLDEKEGEKNCE